MTNKNLSIEEARNVIRGEMLNPGSYHHSTINKAIEVLEAYKIIKHKTIQK